VKDDTEKQFQADTEHEVGDVENNQQSRATSLDSHLDGPINQVLESPNGVNQSGGAAVSESASEVTGSEDSAPVVSPSVTTQKQADELNAEMFEKIDGQDRETSPTNTAENHSQLPPAEEKQASTARPSEGEQIEQPPIRKSNGPRTLLGKEQSKQNAVKHGIYAKATYLKGESRADFQSLRRGLWESLQPEGELEKLLVEKLVSIAWRYRRMLLAEGAEIRKRSEFLELDQSRNEQIEAEEILQGRPRGATFDMGLEPVALIWQIQNSIVLEYCMGLLVDVRRGIKTDGLNEERNGVLLQKIYGDSKKTKLQHNLYHEYLVWLNTSRATEEERQRVGFTSEECKQNMLRAIATEIDRLTQYREKRESIDFERLNVEILRQSVPDFPGLDRLLRYASSLERAFDRTLTQLERVQRIRKGQPVLPPIKLDVSS
jgi:hypothetical protein